MKKELSQNFYYQIIKLIFTIQGQLILKLPEGKLPILYSLLGTSLPPDAIAKIIRQFPAKTKYTESLSVYNWMNRQQRFNCKIESIAASNSNSNQVHISSKLPIAN